MGLGWIVEGAVVAPAQAGAAMWLGVVLSNRAAPACAGATGRAAILRGFPVAA